MFIFIRELAASPVGILTLVLSTAIPTVKIVRKASRNILHSDAGYIWRYVVTFIAVLICFLFGIFAVIGFFIVFVIVWKDTIKFKEPQWPYN